MSRTQSRKAGCSNTWTATHDCAINNSSSESHSTHRMVTPCRRNPGNKPPSGVVNQRRGCHARIACDCCHACRSLVDAANVPPEDAENGDANAQLIRKMTCRAVGQAVASVDWRERGRPTRHVLADSFRTPSSSSGVAFLQRASRLHGARADSLTVLAIKRSESPFDDEAMSGWSALLGRKSKSAEAAAPAPPEEDIDIVELLLPTRSRDQLVDIPSDHLRVLASNPTCAHLAFQRLTDESGRTVD